jgi:hypothetical protein
MKEFYKGNLLPKKVTLPPQNCIKSDIIKPRFVFKIINWIERKVIYNNENLSHKV